MSDTSSIPVIQSTPVIEQQLAHKSVRKYLDTPVADETLQLIVQAAQRASTSSNLHAWSVIVVRDESRKRRLSEIIGGRPYVENAPVFLVWVADLARNNELMRSRGVESTTLGLMENTLLCAVDSGIAAQSALLAAESLGLGGVFVGSVRNNPEGVSEELELPQHAFPLFGMSLGYPDPEEGTGIRPRLPLSGIMHEEQYETDRWEPAVEQFEDEYREYFESQGVPDRSWAKTMTARLGTPEGLHGRHTMRESLARQGFLSE